MLRINPVTCFTRSRIRAQTALQEKLRQTADLERNLGVGACEAPSSHKMFQKGEWLYACVKYY
jgi:hypothetical protein